MARNINLTISHENDGTTRDNVKDYLIHMNATWETDAGESRSFSQNRYLLPQLNWVIQNHPAVAVQVFRELVYRIERVRQGIDDVESL